MTRRPVPPGRAGFTLLEMLTVIVIIGILVGLLLPVIKQVRVAANRGQTTHEMSQLTIAADAFKNEWGAYPPSSFTLPTTKRSDDANFVFLAKKYPRWAASIPENGTISWDVSMDDYKGKSLVGNQCMTFFLGGPVQFPFPAGETEPNAKGWAHDQPAAPSATSNARMTYLEITPSKLKRGITPSANLGFPSDAWVYLDPYGIPYMYWGSNREVGRYTNPPQLLTLGGTVIPGTYRPLKDGSGKFPNEKSCQIISAGADKLFGPGDAWQPGNGSYGKNAPGEDDIANFNNGTELGKTP